MFFGFSGQGVGVGILGEAYCSRNVDVPTVMVLGGFCIVTALGIFSVIGGMGELGP